jgi:uncharacterized protein YodC (DUF2158 family)
MFKLGDIVRCKSGRFIDLMEVIEIDVIFSGANFQQTVECRPLNLPTRQKYDAANLELVVAALPKTRATPKVGDTVRLKSGGPLMTVHTEAQVATGLCGCFYFNDGTLRQVTLAPALLKIERE